MLDRGIAKHQNFQDESARYFGLDLGAGSRGDCGEDGAGNNEGVGFQDQVGGAAGDRQDSGGGRGDRQEPRSRFENETEVKTRCCIRDQDAIH